MLGTINQKHTFIKEETQKPKLIIDFEKETVRDIDGIYECAGLDDYGFIETWQSYDNYTKGIKVSEELETLINETYKKVFK
jgi:hypothetical protein